MIPPLVGLPLLEAATDALEDVQRRVSSCMYVLVGSDGWIDGWKD